MKIPKAYFGGAKRCKKKEIVLKSKKADGEIEEQWRSRRTPIMSFNTIL